MDSAKGRISENQKQAIRSLADSIPQQGLLKPSEVQQLITNGRASFHIAQSVSNREVLQLLLRERFLKEARLDFPSRREIRYFRTEADPYEIALSIGRNSYLTHWTALYLLGLADESSPVYVNSEQRAKPQWDSGLTQDAIDEAFQRPPRISNNHAKYAGRRIYLLNGKFTGGLGVIETQRKETRIRVTDLERTLIDIAVRPHYSGGVSGVLAAYKQASDKLAVSRIAELLAKLNFVYPYHQAIGYYLEVTGQFSTQDLQPLLTMPMRFDFYLAHQMKGVKYSERWRVYYPKSVGPQFHSQRRRRTGRPAS